MSVDGECRRYPLRAINIVLVHDTVPLFGEPTFYTGFTGILPAFLPSPGIVLLRGPPFDITETPLAKEVRG